MTKRQQLHKIISALILFAMINNLVWIPQVYASQQPSPSPAAVAMAEAGERYMDAGPLAIGNALQLAQLLDYINQTPLTDLDEQTLLQARAYALETAQQASTVQGSVGAMVSSLTEMNPSLQAAVDMDTQMSDLTSTGFDPELETALTDFGLTPSQINNLADDAVNNFAIRRDGLSPATTTLLTEAGLSATEITQIEQTLSSYGLADTGLSSKLAQLQASQQEMGLVRTEALISYIQLLTQQIFVQQLAGQTGREMTPTEIDHLVQDQLRLLIHLGYLADLWVGGGPDPDIGEGQWLFIERYSLRVAQRLDNLILETHNVGLVVDLLVALQLHNTALAALAGDADFAAADAATWRDFLAVMVGDDQPQGFGYRHTQPPFWWDEALAMGDYNPAWLSEVEPEPAAIALAQAEALTRVKGLATPLWFPQQQELDPTAENDVAQIIFHTAPMDLPPGVMDIISQNLPGGLLDFVWGVLTGQSDNWWAIGANITLSFVPIFGIVFDFISFMIEPSGWGKAFALIGLVASIITDGAEVLTAVGALVPVSLAATVPGVVLLEVIDGGAAVLKGVNHFVSTSTWNALKKIPFKKVLTKIGPDLIGFLGRKATEVVGAGSWPTSISGFLDLLISVRDKVWTPFSNWFTKRGVPNGFGEGEYLAGRVLATSDEAASYSDEALDSLVKIGDDLAQGGVELSDEAAQGLGKLVNDIGGEKAQRFLKALPCSPGLAQVTSRSAGLASPLLQTPGECQELALKFFKDLPVDDPARTGFSQLVDVVPVEDAIKIFQNKYDDAARLKILGTLSNHWDEFAELPRKVDTERVLDLFAQFEAEDVLKMIKNTDGDEGLDVFAKVLNSGKYDEVLQHLANAHLIKTSPGPGQGFEFHSAFKVGINDDTILLKQIDEIQTSMMSKYGRGDNFEDVSWNCGRCQKYHARIKEMLPTNAPPLEYGNTSGPIAYDVKVDGIGVGDYHIAFEDAQGNIWDPATNTWGQPKEIYDTRVDEIVKE